MNDNEKQFENFVRQIKFDDSPDPNHRDKLEQDLLAALAKQTRQKETPLKVWRTIMQTKITKLATAAAIILIVVLGITILDRFTTPAWAIEQTIEALKRFNAVHVSGIMSAEDRSETGFNLWATANADHSQSRDFRLELDNGQVRCVRGNDTYHYDPNTNTVRILRWERCSINPWLGPKLFQQLQQYTQDWKVSYGTDAATGQDRVFVTCSYPYAPDLKSWWFEFDLETKLPVSFKQWHNLHRKGTPVFDAQRIIYYEDLPDEVFEFEIPEGAKIIEETPERWDKLNDPNAGMLAETMTQEEASVEIVRQYWQAVIVRDWELVAKLRPITSPGNWKAKYGVNPPGGIVEIGEPYQQEGCSIGPVTPLTIKFKDGDIREIKMITKFRDINGESSCIIAGTWGSE